MTTVSFMLILGTVCSYKAYFLVTTVIYVKPVGTACGYKVKERTESLVTIVIIDVSHEACGVSDVKLM